MTNHMSVRLAWHMNGWNGHICSNPAANAYCVGQYSYPGDMIAQTRDLEWESRDDVRGQPVSKLNSIPPCVYSINAFGTEEITAYARPPEWFNDESKVKYWKLPPSTVCTWPYEEMYRDNVTNPPGSPQRYDYDKRLERAREYFRALTPNKSLIFYYANYSNPFSEDEAKRYVLVGISRLKSLGDDLFYEGVSEENKRRYGGGFVWQMPVTSHYPNEGFRFPYHVYLDKCEYLERFLTIPDNERNFKFATRHISDDDALDIVERLVQVVDSLIEIGDRTENWEARKDWLLSLIAELWHDRGAYPGLSKVLDYLGFEEAIPWYKAEAAAGKDKEAKEAILNFLNSKTDSIPNLQISGKKKDAARRQWNLNTEIERKLLSDVLSRIDLQKDQIEKIFASDREKNGILANLEDINDNPYLLSEQFVGDDPDDRISFNKIDHGVLPSPEVGLEPFLEKDDGKRLRALCVERLRRERTHCFMPADKILNDVNNKLSFFPEWKRHQFNARYFEVDRDILEGALVFRNTKDKLYIYLKDVYEDERLIETELRNLAKRPNITFTSPVTESHWHDYLFDPNSVLAEKSPEEYEDAIKGQIGACQKIFSKPFCVITGAAGTGKTTIVNALINAIEKAHGTGTSIQLLAPTGKATVRLRERTGKQASTIHSFLAERGWLNDNFTFKRTGGKTEENKFTYIVDEASMTDLHLAAALFRAINWRSVQRLILVGDSNQLPAIGRGEFFTDIIDWLIEGDSESIGILRTNLRQMENRLEDKGTGILDLANIYLRENTETDKPNQKAQAESILRKVQEGGDIDKDLRIVYWKNQDELKQRLLDTIVADIEADTGENFNNKRPFELLTKAAKGNHANPQPSYLQIISPYRGEEVGTENINLEMQKFFNGYNAENKGTLGGITIFDKIIQFRNRPKSDRYWAYNVHEGCKEQIEVYNGELGYTKPHAFDKGNWKRNDFHIRRFQAWFAGREGYWIDFNSGSEVENNIELAYAISVHKSQGSEFDRVYFILPKSKAALLSSELVYTAITRAQKHLTIFAEEDISVFAPLQRRERSHSLGINSSLFSFKPVPDDLLHIRSWYEEGKAYHTLAEYMVRSKSEVIIANMLFGKNIPFKYEAPLFAPDGTFYIPDFTITWNGEQWYWEHLGLLDREEYRNHWETKRQWYEKHFPGRLITTTESTTLSKDAEEVINNYFS